MKAYVVSVLIVDHDNLGEDEIKNIIENTKYPNRCILPNVVETKKFEIGEWRDSHPLNTQSGIQEFLKEKVK
jgi:hypothetical protein|tara:strand:+ start:691 stop:906 length:216 start_codon:yes stop_codon:yes gene_type:complete